MVEEDDVAVAWWVQERLAFLRLPPMGRFLHPIEAPLPLEIHYQCNVLLIALIYFVTNLVVRIENLNQCLERLKNRD
ncbi:hypothetical protein JHK85_036215 [Glycine max]|nr:hypothetical protein JHK85_036215 [Glycine max]KAG4976152.1 hypothetical protein JHK86_035626 [Glycine max]